MYMPRRTNKGRPCFAARHVHVILINVACGSNVHALRLVRAIPKAGTSTHVGVSNGGSASFYGCFGDLPRMGLPIFVASTQALRAQSTIVPVTCRAAQCSCTHQTATAHNLLLCGNVGVIYDLNPYLSFQQALISASPRASPGFISIVWGISHGPLDDPHTQSMNWGASCRLIQGGVGAQVTSSWVLKGRHSGGPHEWDTWEINSTL